MADKKASAFTTAVPVVGDKLPFIDVTDTSNKINTLDVILSLIKIQDDTAPVLGADLQCGTNNILDVGYLESTTPTPATTGTVRLAFGDTYAIKGFGGSDITLGAHTAGNNWSFNRDLYISNVDQPSSPTPSERAS